MHWEHKQEEPIESIEIFRKANMFGTKVHSGPDLDCKKLTDKMLLLKQNKKNKKKRVVFL